MTALATKDQEAYLRFLAEFAAMEAAIDSQENWPDDLLERALTPLTRMGGSHAVPAGPEGKTSSGQPAQELSALPPAEDLS